MNKTKENKEKLIDEVLSRGVINIIPDKEKLKKCLLSGNKLNIYLGVDPTATKLHIGHAVVLRKLQALSELGHNITFLIGDFTALIGDTSDKDRERPVLSSDKIKENFKTYKRQAEKILDYNMVNIKFNSEWLSKLTFEEIVKLCQHFSVGEFVGRTLIRNRLNTGKRVGLHETLYPVMQGYDSYYLNTDIQIGAADQTFNMQAGRLLNKDLRNKESFILVTDYLPGTDNAKMSKSIGNAIWLEDPPNEMYGKLMSINDSVIKTYLVLSTNLPMDEIRKLTKLIKSNPMSVKKKLAFTIVSELHSAQDARNAESFFEKTFQEKTPEFNQFAENKKTLARTIAPHTSLASISDAKRQIMQGAVSVNNEVITNPSFKTASGQKIKLGKKIFIKVK